MQGKQHQIDLRDVSAGDNLIKLNRGGGKTQVPCLRIEETGTDTVMWLYESDDILSYIKTNNLIS